jgi:hypothetical protein
LQFLPAGFVESDAAIGSVCASMYCQGVGGYSPLSDATGVRRMRQPHQPGLI